MAEIFEAFIETSKGSAKKYQLKNGKLVFDETFPKGFNLPANYGFIPGTMSGDGDPLDVFVFSKPIKPKTKLKIRPIGIMRVLDDGERDDKIIAVPANSKRKTYPKKKLLYWTEHYKGERVKVIKFEGAQIAEKAIIKAKNVLFKSS